MRLSLDSQQGHLRVDSSTYALLSNLDPGDQVLRFDFERGKQEYPEAHIQVKGCSPALKELDQRQGKDRQLGRLHIPVGGLRFRPSLEDFLEFLVVEGFVEDFRPQWKQTLNNSREAFHELQLKAAVNRKPEAAREQLESMGFKVIPPPTN